MRVRCAAVTVIATAISITPAWRTGAALASATSPARTRVISLLVDGQMRTYRLHRPAEADAPMSLVLVLHGAGATAAEVERRYHWDPLADREGFVVAYPQGIGRRWQDAGPGSVAEPKDPDVDFLGALLDDVAERIRIDPARVFVTGISNGGVMTYRAGCALAGRIAAIGPVAAWFPDCLPPTPVSVVHVHGLADEVLPYDGGSGSPAVPVGLSRWRQADGCSDAVSETNEGQVERTVWASCAPGVAIELDTIARGRHEWPGAIPKIGNDPVSHALDATTTIWEFFRAHPRA